MPPYRLSCGWFFLQKSDARLVACEQCDAVHVRRAVGRGQSARCVRCGAVLYRGPWLGVDAMLAMTLAALIAFVMANAWPIVSLGLNGHHNATTLWQAIIAIGREGSGVVAMLAAMTLFVLPLMQILLFLWVLVFIRVRRRPPGFAVMSAIIRRIRPWSLIEVFVLGTLVALVKISGVFQTHVDPGLLAFALLAVFLPMVTTFDIREFWDIHLEGCE